MSDTSMIINYVPGEECRVAIVCDGNLEEFHTERTDAVSRVNNVYVGRVTNVEAGIQAAFVDFGIGDNGFLHISDLHPRYFQDDDATERVGKKTPRKERPPIQQCLKRGQEVIVQVIKEGVGTKGPTLTSYLSIPGRYLVMMPQMDRVGVSRKVEDEEERKNMREILGQLELPDGFGFILRTAGFDRNKTELKRDLAYLQRLWKDMETRRQRGGKKPRLLYSESDLLVRSLRDLVTPDISRIIIDDEGALARAVQFMKIVAPRSTSKVMRYTGRRPLYHAFGIEQQLALSHAREVPLPSGGRLVIDETEAVVAIDVNSGKSRAAKDAETNAYKTNVEAVEAICRQLRLRDIGGIVINDLIDMRSAKNRKAIEQQFRDRLKRDRAKTTIAPISTFGILEMTRQRMRGSLRSQHYTECPTCRGKGLVQRPNSVASDALRELAVLLEHKKITRVELVVSGRVAGELLSSRRGTLNRLERQSGKQVEVRVSDTLAIDRFTLYAYDDAGSDVDPSKLPKPPSPENELEAVDTKGVDAGDAWAVDPVGEIAEDEAPPEPETPELHPIEMEPGDDDDDEPVKKKRRRRRRRKKKTAEETGDSAEGAEGSDEATDAREAEPGVVEASDDDDSEDSAGAEPAAKKKRRRRRRRKKAGDGGGETSSESESAEDGADPPAVTERASSDESPTPPETGDDGEPVAKKKSRRRRRKKAASVDTESADDAPPETGDAPEQGDDGEPQPKKKTRRRKKKAASKTADGEVEPKPAEASGDRSGADGVKKVVSKKPRTLYGSTRRKLAPSEIPHSHED